MKKRNLKNLNLNKESISVLYSIMGKGRNKTTSCLAGPQCPFGPPDDTLDNDCHTGDFC